MRADGSPPWWQCSACWRCRPQWCRPPDRPRPRAPRSGQLVGWGTESLLGGTETDLATSPIAAPAGALAGKVVTQVSTSLHHACALDEAGAAYCWGLDVRGALGNGGAGEEDSAVPAPVVAGAIPAGRTLTQIVTGENDTSCALDNLGKAYCWGSANGQGMLGDGTGNDSEVPVAVAMDGIPGGSFSMIALAAIARPAAWRPVPCTAGAAATTGRWATASSSGRTLRRRRSTRRAC